MNFKKCLLFVLTLTVLCIALSACKEDEETDAPGNEDYTGSITPDSGDTEPDTPDDEPFDEGNESDIVEISTAEDLKKIKPKGTYILMSNIDLGGAEWTPVGSAAHPFSGTLKSKDGENHTISNFTIPEKPDTSAGDISLAYSYAYGGFFGYADGAKVLNVTFEDVTVEISLNTEKTFIYAGAVIGYAKNVKFENVNVSGANVSAQSTEQSAYVGGLAGYMLNSTDSEAEVSKCSVNGIQLKAEAINEAVSGGLAGWCVDGNFTDCEVSGSVSSDSKYGKAYAGGFIGYCSSSTISKCVSSASVTAKVTSYDPDQATAGVAYAGGFAALVNAPDSGAKRTEISDSYTTGGTVTATSDRNAVYAGGFAAHSRYGIFTHCYTRSEVKAESTNASVYAAGLIAYLEDLTDAKDPDTKPYPYDTKLKGCLALGSVTVSTGTEAYFIGALAYYTAYPDNSTFEKCSYTKESATITVNGTALKFEKSGSAVTYSAKNKDDKDFSEVDKTASESLQKKFKTDGSRITSGDTGYGNLSQLGWDTDVWEISEGLPVLRKS